MKSENFKKFVFGRWSVLYIPLILLVWVWFETSLFSYFQVDLEALLTESSMDMNLFNRLTFIRAMTLILIFLVIVLFLIRVPLHKVGLTLNNFWLWAALGLVVAVPISITSYMINAVMLILQGPPPDINPVIKLFMVHDEGLSFLTFLGVIIIPLQEEIIFRGFIYTLLRQSTGKTVSLIITSLLFTVLHMIPVNFPAIFFISVMLCLLYEYTGSITASITCHALFNGISFLLLHLIMPFLR